VSPDRESIRTAVFGGSGYIAGELLRLLVQHPRFKVVAPFSTSQAGEPVTSAFPTLAATAAEQWKFAAQDSFESVVSGRDPLAIFFATPHGVTAALVDRVLSLAARNRTPVKIVDLSADFRIGATDYERLYGHPHAAPARMAEFVCAVPEHFSGKPAGHVAHPGCFTTSVVVGAYPFWKLDLVEGPVRVAAVTGSSGSGRAAAANTHHPERTGNLYAYNALAHRHEQEMRNLIGAARGGEAPVVDFVPHSGPFVRGIHATLFLELKKPMTAEELVEKVNAFYAVSPFIRATTAAPKLTEVVGTNRARIGIMTRGRTLVVTSVVDNLTKGAAGGAVQWMNRLFDLDEDTGLRLPGLFPQ
jgi:N-acetyl-gamma-glutamyl-phosphate reductase common form